MAYKKSKKLRELYSVMKDFCRNKEGIHYMRYLGNTFIISIEDYKSGYIIILTDENDKYIYIGNDNQNGFYIGESISFSTIQEAKEKLKMLNIENKSLMTTIKKDFTILKK